MCKVMKYCFYLILIALIYGCTTRKNELRVFDIEADNIKECALSEIVDSVFAIPLETNSNCLISIVRKVKFSPEHIYVADKQRLYKFDKKGNFINQINKVGRGPGEISTFIDFFVEPENGYVNIITYKKLLRFNSRDSLIDEIPFYGFPEQVQIIDTSVWINTVDMNVKKNDGETHNISQLKRLNKQYYPVDSIIVLDIVSKQGFTYINPGAVFYSFAKNTSYFYYPSQLIEPFSRDTLFQFENNKLIPSFKFDFGEKYYELNRNQKAESGIPPYKKFRINSIYATSYFLFTSYSIEDEDYLLCYDTNKNNAYNMKKGFDDDFFNTGKVMLNQFNFATDSMFFIKNGYEALGKVNGINENSNPILFIVKLKK